MKLINKFSVTTLFFIVFVIYGCDSFEKIQKCEDSKEEVTKIFNELKEKEIKEFIRDLESSVTKRDPDFIKIMNVLFLTKLRNELKIPDKTPVEINKVTEESHKEEKRTCKSTLIVKDKNVTSDESPLSFKSFTDKSMTPEYIFQEFTVRGLAANIASLDIDAMRTDELFKINICGIISGGLPPEFSNLKVDLPGGIEQLKKVLRQDEESVRPRYGNENWVIYPKTYSLIKEWEKQFPALSVMQRDQWEKQRQKYFNDPKYFSIDSDYLTYISQFKNLSADKKTKLIQAMSYLTIPDCDPYKLEANKFEAYNNGSYVLVNEFAIVKGKSDNQNNIINLKKNDLEFGQKQLAQLLINSRKYAAEGVDIQFINSIKVVDGKKSKVTEAQFAQNELIKAAAAYDIYKAVIVLSNKIDN